MIRVSGFYEGREENLSTRLKRAESQKTMPVVTLESGNQLEKENQNMEAVVVEGAEINSTGSTILKKKGEQGIGASDIS